MNRRAAMVTVVAAIVVVAVAAALAPPAGVAHADAAGPTDYRSEVVAISPATDEIRVTAEGGDAFLRIDVAAGHEAIVLGYAGEPYLRIDGEGAVFRNRRSYATYYNEDRLGDVEIPDVVDDTADPDWEHVGDGGAWAWHDHRTHWMAAEPPIGLDPGDAITTEPVPLLVDGNRVEVEVRTVLEPEPSRWPPVLGLVIGLLLGLLGLSLGPASSTLATLVLAGAALLVGATQYWSLPSETGPRLHWWLLPTLALVCAIVVIATYGRSTLLRSGLQALAALELALWAFLRRDVFTAAVLPTDLSFALDRFLTAAVLAGSIVLLVAAGRDLLNAPAEALTAASTTPS